MQKTQICFALFKEILTAGTKICCKTLDIYLRIVQTCTYINTTVSPKNTYSWGSKWMHGFTR